MKKIIAISAGVALALTGIAPTQAADKPTVVVIDSGFDSTKIVPTKEVCILVTNNCNNGKAFDDSVGSSNTTIPLMANWKSEWNHGLIMADIVRQVNPNANLIFIRNAIVTAKGAINIGGIEEFKRSLQWVIDNKTKYNISVVSFSRGQHKASACAIDKTIQSQIVALQNVGVGVAIAAGNNGDKTYIDYPACIPEAIAISGIYSQNYTPKIWSSYRQTFGTNSGVDTDFFAMGNFQTVAGPVAESTSSSTAAFAGYWSKVWNGSYADTYKSIAQNALQRFVNVLQ